MKARLCNGDGYGNGDGDGYGDGNGNDDDDGDPLPFAYYVTHVSEGDAIQTTTILALCAQHKLL